MNYMGGKFRQGKKIARLIKRVLRPEQHYVEPFCGALGVVSRLEHSGPILLGDVSEALINMWKALQDPALVLPKVVTEEDYNQVKAVRDPKDWKTAYFGFGMSFGSKFFGGYARNEAGTDYAANLERSTNLERSIKAEFVYSSYDELDIPLNSVVYCDPPYRGRTKAHDSGEFDHDVFWDWCRAEIHCQTLLITEFTTPPDFRVIHSFGDTVVRHYAGTQSDGTDEVVVVHESQYHLFEKEKQS